LVLGHVRIDAVTFDEALDAVEALVAAGRGGAVFTPNVDHVMIAHEDARMRDAYSRVDLSLPDGMPLLWVSRLLGTPLPEKVSGSDFTPRLLERAAARGWRVFFLGGAPGVAAKARDRLVEQLPGLHVVGVDAPRFAVTDSRESQRELVAAIRATKPDIVLVAFGAPKQEVWIDLARDDLGPAVLLGIGASLDFIAGTVPRAPRWMSSSGLEWLFRLWREPRRMWRRYLVRDSRFVLVVGRALGERARGASPRQAREQGNEPPVERSVSSRREV
jgi:N-acetylglucosaminyldiphosphoundecaprenol N-acetyl-beta-D-mannosaminyltransferase